MPLGLHRLFREVVPSKLSVISLSSTPAPHPYLRSRYKPATLLLSSSVHLHALCFLPEMSPFTSSLPVNPHPLSKMNFNIVSSARPHVFPPASLVFPDECQMLQAHHKPCAQGGNYQMPELQHLVPEAHSPEAKFLDCPH